MDQKASVCNPLDLERMLIDERAEPRNLRLSLLESITNNFSDDLEIGSGGFAVVYMGILQNGEVAVKKLLSKTFDMDERKFHQEVDSLMRVKHKNIVRFLGYCSDTQGIVHKFNGKHVVAEERQRFLCFEFMPLGSLDNFISDASGGLEWRTRYQIIRGIYEGLHYLHQQRIVHLDLKPGNILLDHYMMPKIADFGLSKCFDEKQSGAVTLNLCGTRVYMAPESLDGVITLKSDIYSLGIIIIELLTGQRSCPVIENVLETWSIRFETLKGDTRLEPIRVCVEIGMERTDFNPTKRTDTGRIIARLDEMELKYGIIVADHCTSLETEASSSVSKLVDEVPQSMFMSDEASSPLQRITSSVPKGLGEASSSSTLLSVDDEVESMDVSSVPSPLQLLTIEPKGPGETSDEICYHNGPSKAGELLDIYPLELRFPFVPNKIIDKPLTLTNRTDKEVVFCITPICQQGTCSRIRHPYPFNFGSLLDDEDDDGCCGSYFEFIEPRSTRVVIMRMEKQQDHKLEFMSMFEVVVIIDLPRIKNFTLLRSTIGRKLNLDITFMKIFNSWQIHRAVLTAIVSDSPSCQEVTPEPKFVVSPKALWRFTDISCIDVHPSETWILVGGFQERISIFNYQTQEELITLEVTRPKEGSLRSFFTLTSDDTCVVRSAKFISQEEWFAVGDSHGWVHVYSYNNTRDKVKEFKAYHEISIDLL